LLLKSTKLVDMIWKEILVVGTLLFSFVSCSWTQQESRKEVGNIEEKKVNVRVEKTEEDWRKQLTEEQYWIIREKGTERPYTGKYWNHKGKGVYHCAACGLELFSSDTKYDSGCGWPSFYDAMNSGNIKTAKDLSLGMMRIEIMCARCDGHLGHVFDDGPKPTGMRYCVNSASVEFKSAE
jgi:peptide-methionine (R)-S-oxide reductase